MSGTADFGGTAGNNPTIVKSTLNAALVGSYNFQIVGTIVKLATEFDFYSVADDPKDGPMPQFRLFKF